MSEPYRGDLAAAKQTIANLEEELARLPPVAERRSWKLLGVVIAAATCLSAIGAVALGRLRGDRERARGEATASTADPGGAALPPSAPLVVSEAGLEPLVADLDGDGTEDFVLAMRSRQTIFVPSGATGRAWLHLVAFDGKTLARRWGAGPWPTEAQQLFPTGPAPSIGAQLVLARDLVVVAEGRTVRALDAATGAERDASSFDTPIASVCATADGRVNVGSNGDDERSLSLRGAPAEAAAKPTCLPRRGAGLPPPCARETSEARAEPAADAPPCVGPTPPHETARMSGFERYTTGSFVLHVGDATLASRATVPSRDERSPPYAEARTRAPDRLLWEGPLSLPGESVAAARVQHCLAGDSIVVGYRARGSRASVRLAARDLRTGALRWSASHEGTELAWLECSRTRVYALTSRTFHVHDAASGARLQSVSEDPSATR